MSDIVSQTTNISTSESFDGRGLVSFEKRRASQMCMKLMAVEMAKYLVMGRD